MNITQTLQIEVEASDLVELSQGSDTVITVKNECGDVMEVSLSETASQIVDNGYPLPGDNDGWELE